MQEQVLVDWSIHLSNTAHPITKCGLRKKAQALCGTKPSLVGWVKLFLSRNLQVTLGKPSGLDPSRAWAFSKPVAQHHIKLLDEIITKHNIPVENIYNMDEKGCQLEGGRKAGAIKYLIPWNRRPKYRKQSAELDLITNVEVVSANGESLLPGFIFSGKEFSPEWFQVNPKIM